jgi:hypothetical protein
MSNIIEKEVRPEKGKGKDNEVITLSKAQHDPHFANPNDFVILQPDKGVNAETAGHGQHGNTKADHQKLLRKAAADKDKSKPNSHA